MDRIPSYVCMQGQMKREVIYLELLTKQHLSWNPKNSAIRFSARTLCSFFSLFVLCIFRSSLFAVVVWKVLEGTERVHLEHFFQTSFNIQGPDSASGRKICEKCCTPFLGRKAYDKYLAFRHPKFMNLDVTIVSFSFKISIKNYNNVA